MRSRLSCLTIASALVLAGCGGSDFNGKAASPANYATYHGDGVSISYPKGWKVARRVDSDGGSSVQITPHKTDTTPYGLILLSANPHGEKHYANEVKGRRAVLKAVAKAKIDSDDKVDVPGTKEAHRLTATAPARAGTDPVPIKSDSLDLLRDNGDTLTVVAAAPQRKSDDEFSPKTVVDSVRLSG
jgi:major membrane immunogen (membrane-anchored lipoprotein)